jgi:tetratricopeptide (TPR) repeat protein
MQDRHACPVKQSGTLCPFAHREALPLVLLEQELWHVTDAYLYNQANEAYRDGDNASAIEHYLRALELQPNNIRLLERIGRAYTNLNETEQAVKYFEKALSIDPSNSATLRSLALLYRYTDQEKALKYLNRSLKINPENFEALDFLGLFYRDQGLIDEAISAHEEALKLMKRPETEFYLSMLYAQKGDYRRARLLDLSADLDLNEREHDERIRPIWKTLIRCGHLIFDDNKVEALKLTRMLTQGITTQRINDTITSHLQFLLAATDHKDWIPEFMNILNQTAQTNQL